MQIEKLASRFNVWVITIEVSGMQLGAALEHCMDLGLEPQMCGMDDEEFLFNVELPCGGKYETPEEFVQAELSAFSASLFCEADKIQLLCPPLPAEVSSEL